MIEKGVDLAERAVMEGEEGVVEVDHVEIAGAIQAGLVDGHGAVVVAVEEGVVAAWGAPTAGEDPEFHGWDGAPRRHPREELLEGVPAGLVEGIRVRTRSAHCAP